MPDYLRKIATALQMMDNGVHNAMPYVFTMKYHGHVGRSITCSSYIHCLNAPSERISYYVGRYIHAPLSPSQFPRIPDNVHKIGTALQMEV